MPSTTNDAFATPYDYLAYASRFYVGADTFHESYFVSEVRQGVVGHQHRSWGDFFARFARYSTFWAHYENNVYRKVHLWSDILKDTYNLYRYTRSIFSPAYRSIEFWASHILGGSLDPDAGDGVSVPSALPIRTDNPAIRPVIAQVWRDSNWQARKEVLSRFGAAMGDAAIMVVDDEEKAKVQLRVVDPRTLRDVTRDSFGNVKAYIIEEQRLDPESPTVIGMPSYVTYTEVCEKVGDSVRFATYRNGFPYDWRAYDRDTPAAKRVGAEWTEDYDFVPLVFLQHRDMGLGWGWSELQPSLSKLHELDDVASKLDDWIRITVDAPWLITGCVAPGTSSATGAPQQNELSVGDPSDDAKGRDRIPTFYANDPHSRAHPLVAPLDVAAVSAHLAKILEGFQSDHPELIADDVGPQASGEARKVAREKVEAMVIQRRAGYDDAIVRAHSMAISIGAVKGYPGFEGFTADSFKAGALQHSIGPREVFAVDPSAKTADAQGRALVVKTLTDAGVSLESALEQAGWGADEIQRAMASKAKQDAANLERMRQQQVLALSDVPAEANGPPAFFQ